jgi:hypothetical protein
VMHSYCDTCGERQDTCAHERAPLPDNLRDVLAESQREALADVLHNALCDCRNRGTGFILREADARKAVDALAPTVARLIADARAEALSGRFYTGDEWHEWSNDLASLIPEGDEARYSNPEGAQESIIYDCLAAYVAHAEQAAADRERVEAVVADLWRVSPCGCGHRADLHTMGAMDAAVCTGGLGLCGCNWSFVRIAQARLRAALDSEGGA